MKTFPNVITLAVIGILTSGAPVLAQGEELTAEEIRKRLLTQSTRGLVIAPKAEALPARTSTAATAPVVTPPTTVVELPEELRVDVRVNFDFDSAALRTGETAKIDTMCEVMQSLDIGRYRIVGHTDASGSASYNENLSRLRAEEVKRYLVTNCAITADRLDAVGAGESLLFDKDNPDGDQNRRVEFQVIS